MEIVRCIFSEYFECNVLKHFLYNKEFASKPFKYLKSNDLFLKYFCAGNWFPFS